MAQALKTAFQNQVNVSMKHTFFLVVFAAFSYSAIAQKSNLVFFAENGEKFTIIMNGQRYNETPATNVKLTDLQTNVYKVRAIFEDQSLGVVTKTIQLEPYVEYTFNIRPKKETAVGTTVKKMGNQVARDLNGRDSAAAPKGDKELYVMRFISEVPIAAPVPQQQQTVVVAPPTQQVVVSQPGTVTQTTTTTVRSSGTQPVNAGGANINMSVNDPDMGVNFNMNVGVPTGTIVTNGSTVQQTTTTTTVGGSTNQVVSQTHYIMPGYNGPVGCPWPMDQNTFNSATATINGQSFEENKLQVAQQVFSSNCMTSAQVSQIMQLFSFEDSRLEFAKYAYGRTFDIGNYFVVNNSFTFSSSVDELNAYIRNNGR